MNLVIVDDDFFITTALKTILEAAPSVTVCATGSSADEAVALYAQHQPDVLLMDIRMGEKNGLDATEQILSSWPQAKILLLTTFCDDEYIIRALRLGASGYLLKQDYNSIRPALDAVMSGQTVFGTEITAKLPSLLGRTPARQQPISGLTDREADVMKGVADGLSNREIASRLYLSEGTVRNYLSSALDKLGLRDRTQLAVYYYTHQ